MKKILWLVAGVLLACSTNAQSKKADSLISLLQSATDNQRRLVLFKELGDGENPASVVIKYAQDGYELAKKMNRSRDEEVFLLDLVHGYNVQSDYPKALETTLLGLEISNTINDSLYKCWFLNDLALGYSYDNEFHKSIAYALMGMRIARQIKAQQRIAQLAFNLSGFYISLNRLDSALFYMHESYLAEAKTNDLYIGFPLRGLGDLENKLGHPHLALAYFRQAVVNCNKQLNAQNTRVLIGLLWRISNIEKKQGHADSALYYASKSYKLSQQNSSLNGIYESAEALSELYDGKDQLKSLTYYKISSVAHDSLLSADKAKQFQIVLANQRHKEEELKDAEAAYKTRLKMYGLLGFLVLALSISGILWNSNKKQQAANRLLVKQQNELKQTQNQLIQSEKMASLGELTAGIAHEIQNPLNFVNNFSEVSKELMDELTEELDKGDTQEAKVISQDVIQNLEKIVHHGKRADAIVKGMLQHSQSGSGTKESTNINAMADEFMRLSYHGLRAKDKSFNAEMETHFDEHLPKVNVIPQDMGRVLLNLFNNAFYAVNQKQKTAGADYKPEVSVTTHAENGQVIIKVKDNGVGIPDAIKEKIMQPFFTTKPTGEGTGLGLSLTYDMVVKGHGGSIQVDSVVDKGSEFIICLPLNTKA